MHNIYLSAFFAFLPLLWLLVSLGYFKLVAYKAVFIGLLLSILFATFAFQFPFAQTGVAVLEGVKYAFFPILWVILAAIYTYNLSLRTGGIDVMKEMLTSVSSDQRILALILAFSFGGFLEAAAGFGTAVAIPAGILVAIGYEPMLAALICLIANSVPVAFGALGIPVFALQKVTNLPLSALTRDIALQLLFFCIILPCILIIVGTKSIKGLKGVAGAALVSGISFGIAQTAAAVFLGPELPAVLGALVSLAATVLYSKAFPIKNVWTANGSAPSKEKSKISFQKGLTAWSPYILLLLFIVIVQVLTGGAEGSSKAPPLQQFMTSPGTLMMLSAILGGLFQGASPSTLLLVLGKTLKQLTKTTMTILAIVSMATLLKKSHMVTPIAEVLGQATGSFYPLIAPLLGALGTFVTGSDTSANLLFGALQVQTANQIGADPVWIAASNTAGATAGKMISPQSIAIAASATGLIGKEGEILSKTIKYCLCYIAILGLLVYVVNLF